MPIIYSDAPIAAVRFDTLARAPLAARLVELVTATVDVPAVIGLVGGGGVGKTSILQMTGELCAARPELRAFAVDAWVAGDAAHFGEALVREVSAIFEEEHVESSGERIRDRLFAMGDVVSAVARFAGAKVDVKGALQRDADQLRELILEHTQRLGKRIVVCVDHIDRVAPAEAVGIIKLIARWGTFPYFAFVLAFDRDLVARKLRRVEGTADDIARVVGIELPIPPIDRANVSAFVRGAIADLAQARGIDPGGALALFDVETGVGVSVLATMRDAKRFVNTIGALAPLAPPNLPLRELCVVELVREIAPGSFAMLVDRLRLVGDRDARARLVAEVSAHASRHARADVVAALLAAFAG